MVTNAKAKVAKDDVANNNKCKLSVEAAADKLVGYVMRPQFVVYGEDYDQSDQDVATLVAFSGLNKDLMEMGSMNQKFAEQVLAEINKRKAKETGWALKAEHVQQWTVRLSKRLRTMRRHVYLAAKKNPNTKWVLRILGPPGGGEDEDEENEDEESEEEKESEIEWVEQILGTQAPQQENNANAPWVYRYVDDLRAPIRYVDGHEKETKQIGMVV